MGRATGQAAPEVADQRLAPRTEAKLVVFNRTIATFRAPLLGMSPAARVHNARARLADVLAAPGALVVETRVVPQGRAVQVGGALAFVLTPEDADPLDDRSLDTAAQDATAVLRRVVEETRESRDTAAMAAAAGRFAVGTLAAIALIVLAVMARKRSRSWIGARAQAHAERISFDGARVLNHERVLVFVDRGVRLSFAAATLLLLYVWLGYALAQFPYTRAWGERLNDFLLGVAARVLDGLLRALPDLFAALVIFVIARLFLGMARGFFDRVESGQIELRRLDPDLAVTTRRVFSVVVWLFALAMAYPYLPGSETEAFKGVSVLAGLMVSLGAAGQVGQAMSGLILAYSRIFRRGEYVRVADHEGTVTEVGIFSTRIRTGMGEELTVPNALVLASITRNYSRTVDGRGYVLAATVTIGHDTPWRQVHAMLTEAARRTHGVVDVPAPEVYQTGLNDFYPEYRLVCHAVPSEPTPRARTLSALHASIQDVFNQYGVQIMSPHYFSDPATAKTVAPSDWHRVPAEPPAVREDRSIAA